MSHGKQSVLTLVLHRADDMQCWFGLALQPVGLFQVLHLCSIPYVCLLCFFVVYTSMLELLSMLTFPLVFCHLLFLCLFVLCSLSVLILLDIFHNTITKIFLKTNSMIHRALMIPYHFYIGYQNSTNHQ